MLIASGTALVLLTWCVVIGCMMVIGLPLAALTSSGSLRAADLRRGMWWGLLVVTIMAYLVNLWWPLASFPATVVFLGILLFTAAASAVLLGHRGWRRTLHWRLSTAILSTGLVIAVVYLAVAALGRVTNYDSGLYHLGAIRYAAEYATIPGLANVFFPLGYGSATFPLAGLLENGPWGAEGFRLLNGLIISAVVVDLVTRAAERRWNAGFFVLLTGSFTLLAVMIPLAEYWVTSPSQDSAVFALTVAASAAFAGAIATNRCWVAEAAVAIALSTLLVLMRPTMGAFFVTITMAVFMLRSRRGATDSREFRPTVLVASTVVVISALAAALRDFVLSGWLQYPLSLVAFDVPWRAPDPVNERLATLGYHRDPADLWNAAQGFEWIGSWIAGLPEQWELYAVILLAVATLVALIPMARTGQLRPRGMVVATAPSLVTALAWFLATPPAFRFAWGPLFTCLTIPLGWALWRMWKLKAGRASRLGLALSAGVSSILVVVTFLSAASRLDLAAITGERHWTLGVSIPYWVAPVPNVRTANGTLPGGVVLQMPLDGEQCWGTFPVCTPRQIPSLRSRSGNIADGFLSR